MDNTKSELSEREKEILILVADGKSNKEIAKKLFLSTNTVKVHLRNIFAKIEVSSRTEAAMYAVQVGIINGIYQTDLKSVQKKSQNNKLSIPRELRRYSIPLVLLSGVFFLIFVYWLITSFSVENSSIQDVGNSWNSLASMPTPRFSFAYVTYDNKIYAIGGETNEGVTNVVERFNPETNQWITLKEKPTPVTEVGCTVLGGRIYVPGGLLKDGKVTDVLEIFDPNTNKWEIGKNLPKALSAYAITSFEGKLYLFGGRYAENSLNSVYEYDPDTDIWEKKSSMHYSRAYSGATRSGEKIYVLGGYDGVKPLKVNEVYFPNQDDGEIDPWFESVPLPSGRRGMGVTNIADTLFILGGIGELNSDVNNLQLPINSNEWLSIESQSPDNWYEGGIISLGNQIYIFGGKLGNKISDALMYFQAIYTVSLPLIR